MPNEFINPNWHVVLMHYPLALLTIGVLIELFSCSRCPGLRTAGRWMILIGALLIVPTVTLGLYAFRDVVTAGPIEDYQSWHQVAQNSPWTDTQWHFMMRHVWLMSIATGLFLLGAVAWLGASDDGRRKLRWPVLLVLLIGLGAMSAGAWYSGEAVYRYGTAVERASPLAGVPQEHAPATTTPPGTAPAGASQERTEHSSELSTAAHHDRDEEHTQPTGVEYYLPPLQVHVLLAGLTVAMAVGALGASLRRWSWRPQVVVQTERIDIASRLEPGGGTTRLPAGSVVPVTTTAAPTAVTTPAYAARYWLLAFLLGAGTASAGLWLTGDWRLKEFLEPLRDAARRSENPRMFFHVIFGSSIVLLTLLVALITRVTRRGRGITLLFVLLLLLAVAGQVWLGILLLFDSDRGPLTRFNM